MRRTEEQHREQAAFNRSTGADGEDWAAEFLIQKGYHLVSRNWRNPRDLREELDLVCLDQEVLVFVEVKTRKLSALTPGYHAVTVRKKRALRRSIQAFLWSIPEKHRQRTHRVDVIEVGKGWYNPPEIRHYENVSLRTPRPWR